jgi:D-threo-aldose 1-dehydrogenase
MKPEDREDLLIGSKVGDECPPFSNNGGFNEFSYDGVKCSIEHSLKQLKVVDKLDTVLVHDAAYDELETFLAPGNGMDALVDLKRQGVVGHIGIGCVEFE